MISVVPNLCFYTASTQSGQSSFSKADIPVLLDYLVGAHEDGIRNRDAERLGGLHVHHQLELRWLLDRQITWLCALEALIDIDCGPLKHFSRIGPVAHQAADFWKCLPGSDARHTFPCG